MNIQLLKGDCLDKLKELDDNSIDSVVTDPPYGFSFMGKSWDYDVPSLDIWKEIYRVLKPGGHLLSFSGSRTYHRMAVRIEDAGFEIRDQIMWLYGSGFPKSHNVGRAYDEAMGNERKKVERPKEDQRPNADKVRAKDGKVGKFGMSDNKYTDVGNSQWEGWGTALKPAHEPICMARKPFDGTVVENVIKHGTGAINIDGSRIGLDGIEHHTTEAKSGLGNNVYGKYKNEPKEEVSEIPRYDSKGRFPANVILDEEAGRQLDEQTGELSSGFMKAGTPRQMSSNPNVNTYGHWEPDTVANDTYGDSGGASRFFYCPKASKDDREEGLEHLEDKLLGQSGGAQQAIKEGKDEYQKTGESSTGLNTIKVRKNIHPTVKPTDLMKYLIRLITPEGGTTLDPFMGSGSTGKAAKQLGFGFVGIEKEDEYFEIAKSRIESAMKGTDTVVPKKQQEKINKFFDL